MFMHSSMQLVLIEGRWQEAVKIECNDHLHLSFEAGQQRFVITAGTTENARAEILAFLQKAMLTLMEAPLTTE